MRVIRVAHQGRTFYAALGDGEVACLNRQYGYDQPIPLGEVTILPCVMPTKVICVGINYAAHGEELDWEVPEEPMLFFKPSSSVIGSGQQIVLPAESQRVDYEAELAVVMGQTARNISEDEAPEAIFGYTCANDVTARDIQERESQFFRCKGFDTFCPIGPWIETEPPSLDELAITTTVNGNVVQQGTTADMIHKPHFLVSHISRYMTLNPGDVILTGTPRGVGQLHPGDEVRIEVENVGLLINPVMADETQAASEGTEEATQPPVQ